MRPSILATAMATAALCASCRSHQRVELVNSTAETVTVTMTGTGYHPEDRPRADVAPGGRFKYVSSGGRYPTSELRVSARGPGPLDARRLVGEGAFRGWIRRTGGSLVIEEAGSDLPPW